VAANPPAIRFARPSEPPHSYFIVGSLSQRPPRASAELEFCGPPCWIPYREDLQPSIIEAVSRPQMRFVARKTVEQQDLQALHRIRSRLIGSRTQIGNQIRGLLTEYGIVLPQHLTHVRKELPRLIDDKDGRLSDFAKRLFGSLYYEELQALDQRILAMESEINQAFQQNTLCLRIREVEGIGPVTATAVIAAISNGNTFKNGR